MWHLRRRRDVSEGYDVVGEALELLDGRAALVTPGAAASPAWLAVNTLAHASASRLREVASAPGRASQAWYFASLSYLASQLLAAIEDDVELVAVQREVLLPLELDLLGDGESAPTTPAELSRLVIHALDARSIHGDC